MFRFKEKIDPLQEFPPSSDPLQEFPPSSDPLQEFPPSSDALQGAIEITLTFVLKETINIISSGFTAN